MTGQEVVDLDWLVSTTWLVLHHATIPADRQEELLDNGGLFGDDDQRILLTCGVTVKQVNIPGVMSRLSKPRCVRCCARLGLPQGKGSPKNDDECRRVLGLEATA